MCQLIHVFRPNPSTQSLFVPYETSRPCWPVKEPDLNNIRAERFLEGAETSAVRAAILRITVIRRVFQAHFALGALEIGNAAANFRTNADAGAVSCNQTILHERIVDANLTLLRALNTGQAGADGVPDRSGCRDHAGGFGRLWAFLIEAWVRLGLDSRKRISPRGVE